MRSLPPSNVGEAVKSDFCRSRIHHGLDFRDTVCREASLDGMGTNHLFGGSDVNTVNLVSRHVAVEPLDFLPEATQNAAGFLRDGDHLIGRHISDAGKLA